MTANADDVRAMYAAHPISAAHIIARLGPGPHKPEALWPHDQDHYGGLAANAALADAAGMKPGDRVADFCAGLGGPARWWAHVRGVHVTGVDLSPDRVAGARALTALVGLSDRVEVIEGSVAAAPLPDAAFDAVVSQEALLHVPPRAAALAEAFRVLKPGGRLALTDVVARGALAKADAELIERGLQMVALFSPDDYRAALAAAGFVEIETVDLTAAWAEILKERLAMYLALREETAAAGRPQGDPWFHKAYPRFVEMVATGPLAGLRVTAKRPG